MSNSTSKPIFILQTYEDRITAQSSTNGEKTGFQTLMPQTKPRPPAVPKKYSTLPNPATNNSEYRNGYKTKQNGISLEKSSVSCKESPWKDSSNILYFNFSEPVNGIALPNLETNLHNGNNQTNGHDNCDGSIKKNNKKVGEEINGDENSTVQKVKRETHNNSVVKQEDMNGIAVNGKRNGVINGFRKSEDVSVVIGEYQRSRAPQKLQFLQRCKSSNKCAGNTEDISSQFVSELAEALGKSNLMQKDENVVHGTIR